MPPRLLPPPFPAEWTSPFPPEPADRPEKPAAEAGTVRPPLREPLQSVAARSLWAVVDNSFRWGVLLRLAAGEELTAVQAGEGSGLRKSTIRKHLAAMRGSRVIESRTAPDGRTEIYFLRPACRPAPGVLEFGECCVLLGRPAGNTA